MQLRVDGHYLEYIGLSASCAMGIVFGQSATRDSQYKVCGDVAYRWRHSKVNAVIRQDDDIPLHFSAS